MKKLMTISGVFLFFSVVLTSCSDSAVTEKSTNNDMVEDSNNDTNFEKLTACDCAKIMKYKNPLAQAENEGRDAEELQEEWVIIWSPCKDREEPGFMQDVLKCVNTLH